MAPLFFWRTWQREYRYTWLVTALVFFASLFLMWYGYFRGPAGVTHWTKLQEQKIIDVDVHTFRLGPFEINVPAESYVILEHFNASRLQPDVISSYFYLGILAISISLLVSVVTTLGRFWFFFGMTLVIVVLISFRFEVLGLFGTHHMAIPATIVALYTLPSVYFNLFLSIASFLARILTFSLITLLLFCCIWYFSTVPVPYYQLYLTSFTPGIILSILFIILVGHEIMAGFVYMAGQGSKSLQHLLIISVVYLINVFLSALHELGVVNWDFIYLNGYLLLSISAVVGIWGYRNREVLYGNILPFYPFAALMYLALGAICFATAAHLLANVNDPGQKIIREVSVFVHAGYGLMFLLYMISNFGDILSSDRPAYRVMYTPRRMPYFSYRLAGLIATLAFIVYANWRDYIYHGVAAFYNIAGDLHTMMNNETYAESFYFQGYRQGFENYRSSYMLAHIKSSKLNVKEAHYFYGLANEKAPTEYSLVNAGNIYFWTNDYFKAIRSYKDGLDIISGSPYLANNAGVGYLKVKNVDSSAFFLNRARDNSSTKNTAEMNFFGLAAAESIPIRVDSVLQTFDTESPGTISNALAAATLFGTAIDYRTDPLVHKKLNLYTATLLNNYIIQNAKKLDTVFVNEAYRVASDPANASFSEALKASLAFAYYHQGNVARAMSVLAEQVFLSHSYQGKFNYIMGLWALEQGNPQRASTFFSYADTYDFKDARFYNAIAVTETRNTSSAINAWDSVLVHGDESQRVIANQIKRILAMPASEAVNLTDAEKYQFCRYRIGTKDSVLFNRLNESFNNDNYKAQALLDASKMYFEAGMTIPAIQYYRRIAGLRLTDRKLYEDVRHFELRMLASRGEVRQLANQINDGIEFGEGRNLEKIFYTALLADANGDSTDARKNYEVLAFYNPYFEEGVIAAFEYFKRTKDKNLYPYTILAEAIQVNPNSLRLLRAYRNEALRVGLTDYASSVEERIFQQEKTR